MSDMNQLLAPFQPLGGPNASTVSIAAAITTGNVQLPTNPGAASDADPNAIARQYAIWNSGSTFAFVAFGGSGVVATVPSGATPGSFPVSPGAGFNGPPATITVPGNPTYMAAIMASSTATLYVCPGNGAGA